MSDEAKKTDGDEGDDRFEMLSGLLLAVFAAILSVNGLGGGKFGGDEAIANIDKGSQFSWLQSKSIKKSLTEAQVANVQMLLDSGLIPEDKQEKAKEQIAKNKAKVERYDHEIKIIQEGPGKYEKEEWFAKLDDEKIKTTTGAEEHEAKAKGLNEAGDIFDYGELFLQLCLVLGAVSLITKNEKMKKGFFAGLIISGVIGSIFTFIALEAAWPYL